MAMFYINVLLGIVRAINWTVVTRDSTISLPIALSPWFCRSVVKGMCLLYTLYINFIDSLVLRLRENLTDDYQDEHSYFPNNAHK